MKDSGSRQKFTSGAMRDVETGKGRFDLLSPIALWRLAQVFEKGAGKYAPRNWEKGMPISRFCDSAIRHLMQFMMGMDDEDHLGHAMWNIGAIMHLVETKPELNDLKEHWGQYKPFVGFLMKQAEERRGRRVIQVQQHLKQPKG